VQRLGYCGNMWAARMGFDHAELKGSDVEEPKELQEYVVFPEEAIKHLPEEWQKHVYELKKKRRRAFWRQQMTI
jgi:hypothetical protein